jgi:hypothetical protein
LCTMYYVSTYKSIITLIIDNCHQR